MEGQLKRGRGRPRKYPLKSASDFESVKYDKFFEDEKRKIKENEKIDLKEILENVFQNIYKGKHSDKLFSHPEKMEDVVIFDNLFKSANLSDKNKSEKTCDDVFYEYLSFYKDKANKDCYTLLVKFVILFKECYDISKNKDNEKKEAVTNKISPEGLPDLCNEFYGEFLEQNNFFEMNDDDKNEIIDIIQHFCIWLFKNEYTKSKLSLAA